MEWHRHKSNTQVCVNREGELVYLTFPILEETGMVRHLFSTRMGGVSEGIYRSMNLSYTRGDEKEAVDENFRRIACRRNGAYRLVGAAEKGKINGYTNRA